MALSHLLAHRGLCGERFHFRGADRLFQSHPVAPPRQLLYPMPFVGLALLTIDRVGMMDMPSMLVWALLMLPGPVYVHLSWAPRWQVAVHDRGRK